MINKLFINIRCRLWPRHIAVRLRSFSIAYVPRLVRGIQWWCKIPGSRGQAAGRRMELFRLSLTAMWPRHNLHLGSLFLPLLLSLFFFPTQACAFSWKDLWYTSDQQGQELMKQHQFSKAKKSFRRKDWAATAAYREGDYQQAAEGYLSLGTETGYYNQGNALAHLGKYQEAIAAYNQALAFNPKNQDAKDNRKLLEDLLKKQQENPEQDNKDQQNSKQGNKDQQNPEQDNKDQQNSKQGNKDQQNSEQDNKDQQNSKQENKDQQNSKQGNKDQQNSEQDNKDQQNSKQNNKDQQNSKQENKDQLNNREKQQAKEQWLRIIPDDPGGLMREKFLRDHLKRENKWY